MQSMWALSQQDMAEIADLYRWGARMCDLKMLYGCSRPTIKKAVQLLGGKMRPPHREPLAIPVPHSDSGRITSTRPRLPEGVLAVDGRPTPDQLLCSSAHAQRDRRIAAHRSGVKTGSCPGVAS